MALHLELTPLRLLVFTALALGLAAPARSQECLDCHAQPGMSVTFRNGETRNATVDKRAEMRGKCVSEGRLNVYGALSGYDVTPPGTVTDLRVAAAGGSRVTLTFTAPDCSFLLAAQREYVRSSKRMHHVATAADHPIPRHQA